MNHNEPREDWEEEFPISTFFGESKVQLVNFIRAKKADWQSAEFERGQKHAFGVDRAHVSGESRTAALDEILAHLAWKRRMIGTGTYCLHCKQHIAAGDCDCNGVNAGLNEAISTITELQNKVVHNPIHSSRTP